MNYKRSNCFYDICASLHMCPSFYLCISSYVMVKHVGGQCSHVSFVASRTCITIVIHMSSRTVKHTDYVQCMIYPTNSGGTLVLKSIWRVYKSQTVGE